MALKDTKQNKTPFILDKITLVLLNLIMMVESNAYEMFLDLKCLIWGSTKQRQKIMPVRLAGQQWLASQKGQVRFEKKSPFLSSIGLAKD